jgi:hypothetical protein
MKYQFLPRLSSMFAVWLLLVSWNLSAPHIGDLGNLVFLVHISVPLSMSGAEAAFYRRHAFRNEYLIQPSWFHRLMGMEPLILGIEIAKALLLAVLLMVGTVALSVHEWALLLLDVLILALLMPRMPALLHSSVNRTYLYAMSRRWAIWFSTLLLWGESVLALLLANSDDYRGLSWEDAVAYSTSPETAADATGVIAVMRRIDAGADGLASWSSYQLLHTANVDLAQMLVATMALVSVLLMWFLLAWAYSRALLGTLARVMEIWRARPPRRGGRDVFENWWL